jgi:putative FmdB family regulatory protein
VASYDFRCTACDHAFTRLLPMRDLGRVAISCPACGSRDVERVFVPFYAKTIRKS